MTASQHIGSRVVRPGALSALRWCKTPARAAPLPPEIADALPNVLRVSQYYTTAAELCAEVVQDQQHLGLAVDTELQEAVARFKMHVADVLGEGRARCRRFRHGRAARAGGGTGA